jgi:hypothetical protein
MVRPAAHPSTDRGYAAGTDAKGAGCQFARDDPSGVQAPWTIDTGVS